MINEMVAMELWEISNNKNAAASVNAGGATYITFHLDWAVICVVMNINFSWFKGETVRGVSPLFPSSLREPLVFMWLPVVNW